MALLATIRDLAGLGQTWPPKAITSTWEEIELFAAFRDSDETRLRQEAQVPWRDAYMFSPVPRMISRASAHMLFGEEPRFGAAEEADDENLARIVGENELAAECHRAAIVASSEGSVWGRVVVDPALLEVPIIEFVSPARVIPHFSGRFVAGATFVTQWATGAMERYRLLETYEAGVVSARLFRGGRTTLGGEAGLQSFEPTKGRRAQTLTGIDWPLVSFVPNTIDADPARGYSDYAGLRDRFLAVNEAATVGQANLRLAGRKRAIVDAGYLNDRGTLPQGEDVFIRTSRQGGDGEKTSPLQVIDYEFDASQNIAWLDHLIDTTLTFAGISPQSVGRNVAGGAVSGIALKLKMSHSLMEAAGKGRFFDRGLRRLLRAAQILDGRPISEGGFGRTYSDRDSFPSVERGDAAPRDDIEAAARLATLVGAESISLEQRVAFLHPGWSAEQIGEELSRLRAERPQPAKIATERPPLPLS